MVDGYNTDERLNHA